MNILKSKTVWASLFVTILPYTDTIIGVASGVSPVAGAVIGGVFFVLRTLTTTSLSDK